MIARPTVTALCILTRPRSPVGAASTVAFAGGRGFSLSVLQVGTIRGASSTAKGDTMGCGLPAYPYLRAGGL